MSHTPLNTMLRRRFLTLLSAGAATSLLAACEDMPASAIAPWSGPAPDVTDARVRALSWALLAPNPHNLQSWIADVRESDTIVLHVDGRRLLPQTDPPGRQILIGCGAFLELLALAAAAQGFGADITLFPEGEPVGQVDTRPVARVRMTRQPDSRPDPLLAHALARRTNRRAYSAQAVQSPHWQALAAQAALHRVALTGTSVAAQVAEIGALALEGYRVEFGQARTWQESADVMRLGTNEVAAEPSGIALLGPQIWWGRTLGLVNREALRDPAGVGPGEALKNLAGVLGAGTSSWLWLTAGNSRTDQVAVGRAYLRVCLQATALGLAMHPNSQVLQEFAEMQALYRQTHQALGVRGEQRIHMLARVGWADTVPPAPRRPVAALIRNGGRT